VEIFKSAQMNISKIKHTAKTITVYFVVVAIAIYALIRIALPKFHQVFILTMMVITHDGKLQHHQKHQQKDNGNRRE
jgi:hypothetical protein